MRMLAGGEAGTALPLPGRRKMLVDGGSHGGGGGGGGWHGGGGGGFHGGGGGFHGGGWVSQGPLPNMNHQQSVPEFSTLLIQGNSGQNSLEGSAAAAECLLQRT